MSELKPCPFCGSKALTNTFLDYEDIENLPTNVIDDYEPEVTCENERCIYGWWLSPKDWNTRPIEDALNARIIEVTHLYLQTKDAFNLVTEVLLKQDARIAKLEEKLAELVEVGNKMRDLIEQDYDGYLDETIEWRGVAEEADDVLQEREE